MINVWHGRSGQPSYKLLAQVTKRSQCTQSCRIRPIPSDRQQSTKGGGGRNLEILCSQNLPSSPSAILFCIYGAFMTMVFPEWWILVSDLCHSEDHNFKNNYFIFCPQKWNHAVSLSHQVPASWLMFPSSHDIFSVKSAYWGHILPWIDWDDGSSAILNQFWDQYLIN